MLMAAQYCKIHKKTPLRCPLILVNDIWALPMESCPKCKSIARLYLNKEVLKDLIRGVQINESFAVTYRKKYKKGGA